MSIMIVIVIYGYDCHFSTSVISRIISIIVIVNVATGIMIIIIVSTIIAFLLLIRKILFF